MQTYELQDNTVDNYIPITPTKPQIGYIVKEESQQFSTREYNYDGVNNIENTSTSNTLTELNVRQNLTSDVKDIPTNGGNSATDYIGAIKYDVPYIINPDFANFLLLDVQANPFTTLANADIESLAVDLYDSGDTNSKVVNMFNGMQGLRIPLNKFNTIVAGDTTKNYGKYYIKVAPKYVDVPVTQLILKKHVEWQLVNGSDAEGRRQVVRFDNNNFRNTPWLFENNPLQRGRLHGSVVEIWNASKTQKKQTKILVEEGIDLSNSSGIFVLTPDVMGYDSANEVLGLGDILRVYPRETYFNPIYIEISYTNKDNDLLSLIQFMKNDAVRDLTSNVIEVYDDNGVGTDANGNLTGTIIQSYQISQENNKEIRRQINLD